MNKVISSSIWNIFERFSSQLIRFILNLVLARVLFPSDYGLIGMLIVFIAVSQSIVEGGFINALIQKKNKSDKDFSTIFLFSLFTSLIIYIIFYFLAPYVSEFYNEAKLTSLMRVLSLSIIFISFSVVPISKLHINLDFKKQARAIISSSILSSLLAIYLAFDGYGVWALVYQNISSTALQSIFLFYEVKWKPKLVFNKKSMVDLIGFGSKILSINLLDKFIRNIYFVLIGKLYGVAELGYYTRAEQFSQLPSSNIAGVFKNITFPQMCEMNDNKLKLKNYYENTIVLSCIITFPILLFISFYSEYLVLFTLTEKWIEISPLLKFLAITGLIYPINFLNTNLLLSIRRTDLFIQSEFIKKAFVLIVLLLTINYGILTIIYGQIFVAILSLMINFYFTSKVIDYSLFYQFCDIIPFFIVTYLSFYLSSIILNDINEDLLRLIFGFLLGLFINFSLIFILNFRDSRNLILNLFKK